MWNLLDFSFCSILNHCELSIMIYFCLLLMTYLQSFVYLLAWKNLVIILIQRLSAFYRTIIVCQNDNELRARAHDSFFKNTPCDNTQPRDKDYFSRTAEVLTFCVRSLLYFTGYKLINQGLTFGMEIQINTVDWKKYIRRWHYLRAASPGVCSLQR